jgi:tripartite-type tricarboxylate transporter receptor subunit TctC
MSVAIALASTAAFSAPQCGVVIDYPPGGSSDAYARLMQKNNPELLVEYKVGGMSANAINFMAQNKHFFYLGSPVIFGANSPMKDPPVELGRILIGTPIMAINNKNLTWEQLLNGKVNVGVPGLGTAHHIIALQLKEHNPNIEIIPTGGDNKALPLIMNKDLDLYLVSATSGKKFVADFNFENMFTLQFNKPYVRGKVELLSIGFNGAFINRDVTPEQREALMACIERSVSPKEWKEGLKALGGEPADLSGAEKDKALATYIRLLKKYGL